jgi:large repetitive protein
MISSLSSRATSGVLAIFAAVALVAAPLVVAPAAAAPGYVGTESGSDVWVDKVLATMEKDVAYSSTLEVPDTNGPWYLDSYTVPDGISVSLSGVTVTVSGTPAVGGTFSGMYFSIGGGDGASSTLTFGDIYIDPGLPASETTVTSPAVAPHSAMDLEATVTGDSPTGTVTFSIGGDTIGSGTLSGGIATYTGAISSSYRATTVTITATYGGDDANAGSSDTVDVYIYGSDTVSGSVTINGGAASGTVELLDHNTYAVLQETTLSGGDYSFTIDGIDTFGEATTTYFIRAVLDDATVYYAASGGAGHANVDDIADADFVSPASWGSGFDLFVNVPPVWSDTTLATPHQDAEYSDYVAATGTATLHYSVTAGGLPSGLELDGDTGEIRGTPTNQLTATFTITASNDYGSVEHEFTLTPGAPGVAPTWTSTDLDDMTVDAAFSDAVAASGDPTIVYSVSVGSLPAGLELNSATGAITGTPTTAGDVTFTLRATNAFGHVDHEYEITVAAAPEIDLQLNFAPGTKIGDATSEISASGLKVNSEYTLTLHSTPVLLYTGTIDSTGSFTHTVTIPADTPVGAHELILTGIAPDGSTMTAHAWFTLLADGTIGAVSYTGPLLFTLALTGDNPLPPLGFALASLAVGAFLLRRRRALEQI